MKQYDNSTKKYYENYKLFNPYKNKIYWIIVITITFILVSATKISVLDTTQDDINLLKFIGLNLAIAIFISLIVLAIRVIIYIILDFIYSDTKGRLLLLILIIVFALKACAEISRSR